VRERTANLRIMLQILQMRQWFGGGCEGAICRTCTNFFNFTVHFGSGLWIWTSRCCKCSKCCNNCNCDSHYSQHLSEQWCCWCCCYNDFVSAMAAKSSSPKGRFMSEMSSVSEESYQFNTNASRQVRQDKQRTPRGMWLLRCD